MKKFEVKTEGEFKGDVREAKKPHAVLSKIGDAFLIALVIVALLFSGTVFYFKLSYVPCFVSGMSMFPTLNVNGTNKLGNALSPYNSVESTEDGSTVDFLLADEKKGFLDKVERFDIVCSFYKEDYAGGVLLENACEKIKRVVGFPGETIWLVTSTDEGSKYCGKLYVSDEVLPFSISDLLYFGPNGIQQKGYNVDFVSQPLEDSKYDQAVKSTFNNDAAKYNNGNSVSYNYVWTLGSDEYLLLGDNRASSYSRDSRSVGLIKESYIQARVSAVIGKAKIKQDGSSASFKFFSFKWRSM